VVYEEFDLSFNKFAQLGSAAKPVCVALEVPDDEIVMRLDVFDGVRDAAASNEEVTGKAEWKEVSTCEYGALTRPTFKLTSPHQTTTFPAITSIRFSFLSSDTLLTSRRCVRMNRSLFNLPSRPLNR